jgi:hypothetical protein
MTPFVWMRRVPAFEWEFSGDMRYATPGELNAAAKPIPGVDVNDLEYLELRTRAIWVTSGDRLLNPETHSDTSCAGIRVLRPGVESFRLHSITSLRSNLTVWRAGDVPMRTQGI